MKEIIMKKYTLLALIFTCILLALALSSCKKEHQHTMSDWITDVKSTCNSFGYEYRKCLECGVMLEYRNIESYAEHVEATEHGYAPTCMREGLTDGTYCSYCGVTIVEQESIPTIDHHYVLTSTKEPTCTTEGYKTYTCQCGYSYQECYSPALQHDSVLDDYVPPTCTEDGYSMGYHCSRCGEVTIEQSVIPALGHYYMSFDEVKPTCTESGLVGGSYCGRCEEVFVQPTVISPKGHKVSYYEGWEPDCVNDGYTRHYYCTVCSEVIEESVSIPANGHSYISSTVIPPTCLRGGYTESLCHCGYVNVTDHTDALGHDEVIDPAVEPACTMPGYTEGSHCDRCGKILIYQNVISNLWHDISTVKVNPTLDADGSITDTCSRCDYVKVTPIVLRDYTRPGNYWGMFLEHTDSYGKHYVVPEIFEVDGVWYKVVSIAERAFSRDDKIASIVLPDTITSIADSAFKYCDALRSVTLPSNLEHIGDYAFHDCESLVDIELPDSLISIGDYAFWDCLSLTEIHLGSSLTEIGEGAFSLCKSITSLTIPGNVSVIKAYAFSDLHKVEEIIICEGVERIEEGALSCCSSLTRLVLPDSIRYVGNMAFYFSTIISVEIGEGDVVFDDNAFSNCYSLTTLVIGAGKKTFSPTAFAESQAFSFIYDYGDIAITFDNPITENVKVIIRDSSPIYKNDGYEYTYTSDNLLFRYNGEKHQLVAYGGIEDTVTLPETFGGEAYEIYRMTGVYHAILPSNITVIPANAFYDSFCLKAVTIPESVVEIGHYAFYNTGLLEITLPDSVEVIGEYSFSNCNRVKSITLSSSLKIISDNAFRGSGNYDQIKVHVTIPDSVESIGDLAFFQFTGLGDVTIGKGLSSIGYSALGRPNTITVSPENGYFKSIDGTLYSKDGKVLILYRGSSHAYGEGFVIPAGVTTIESEAFSYSDIYFIEFPASVTTIKTYAFYNCYNLTRIKLGKGVTTVENLAFGRTQNVTEIILNANIKTIGADAFFITSDWNGVIYYEGIKAQWNNVVINDVDIRNYGDPYFYYERKPTLSGPYWHYDAEGNPVLWDFS